MLVQGRAMCAQNDTSVLNLSPFNTPSFLVQMACQATRNHALFPFLMLVQHVGTTGV